MVIEGGQTTLFFGTWYRKSPFFDAARRAGCYGYDVYNKMYIPSNFADPVEEYWLLVNHVTIWDVGCERQVEICGPDGYEFMECLTPRDLSTCRVVPAGRWPAVPGSRILAFPGGEERWHPGTRDADGLVRRSRVRDLSPRRQSRHRPVGPCDGRREALQPPAHGALRVPSDRGGHPELSLRHQLGVRPVRGRARLARRPREETRLHRTDVAEEN